MTLLVRQSSGSGVRDSLGCRHRCKRNDPEPTASQRYMARSVPHADCWESGLYQIVEGEDGVPLFNSDIELAKKPVVIMN